MAHKSPMQTVSEKFGDKKKLVEAVEGFTKGDDLWVARTNKDKGLAHVSNTKLLRLHQIFTTVKEKFGTRAKLIDAILDLTKRGKDEGYKAALGKYPVPRLYDLYTSTKRRADGPAKAEKAKSDKAAAKPAKKAAAPAAKKPAAAPAKKSAKPAAKKK